MNELLTYGEMCMHFHMFPSLNYAPVHAVKQTSALSPLCDYNLTVVVMTESLMPSLAASASTEVNLIGMESHTNVCFTAGPFIVTDIQLH